MHDIHKIKETIIEKSFPELKGKGLKIHVKPDYKGGLSEFFRIGFNTYHIQTSNVMREAPQEAVEGLIAHELVHIVKETKMNVFSSLMDGIAYKLSKDYRTKDERSADLSVIARGYGNHLLALSEFRFKIGLREEEDNGLTMEEIKKLIERA